MDLNLAVENFLMPSLFTGVLMGGAVFLFGLGVNLCLKLFNQ